MSDIEHVALARAALAAASTSEGDALVFWVASARAALTRAADELASLRLLIDAREAELVRREAPAQLEIEEPSR